MKKQIEATSAQLEAMAEQTKKLKKGNMMEENNKGLAKKRSGYRNKKGRKKELRGGAFGQKRTQTGSTPKNQLIIKYKKEKKKTQNS